MKRARFLYSVLLTLLLGYLLMPVDATAQRGAGQREAEREIARAQTEYIQGLVEFESENYRLALDHLHRAYERLADHSGVNYALADAYLEIDDLANAAFYGKRAADLEPENKWYRLKLAAIYQQAGRNRATIDELNAALEYNPNSTDIMYRLAGVYARHREFLLSNNIYNRLLEIAGPEIGIYFQKLQNFNRLNMRDSSIVQLEKIRELDPDNLSTLQMLSDFYLEDNDVDQAKRTLREALSKNSRDPATLIMLADIYVDEADWDSVGTLLGNMVSDPIIENQDKLDIAQYLFSRYQQNSGNPALKEALAGLLDRFISSEPDYGAAHALAADFYLNEEEHDLALQALARTNELTPGNDLAWRQRLQLLLADGAFDEAIEAGIRADSHIPQDPFILYFVGNAYLARGEASAAVEWLTRATRTPARRSTKSIIYGSLGNSYFSTDNWERAMEAYEEALELDPRNHEVLNNYAYYLAERNERLDYAEEMALQAVELEPANASYLDTIGWVYYKQGNFERAHRYIETALNTGEAGAEIMEHMGDILYELDEREEARKWWQQALDQDSTRTYLRDKLQQ